METEELRVIIEKHNKVVTAIKESKVTIPMVQIFQAMSISVALADEALELVHIARNGGIMVKASMQSGEIVFTED